ncbi:alpha/beta hydrolase-fold protein [Agromyces sp. NPDC058110]|uniref:alpha/beta hydrolase-fold protein n=1 Tax=Agromyces sp. NPDC058110 TaxID=3346345 RepID=UPI0036D9A937
MFDAVLDVGIVGGSVLITFYVLSAALFVYLLCREASVGWAVTAIVVIIVGALIGGALLWLTVNLLDLFGGPVSDAAWIWVPAATGAILLAIWNLWRSRWWRKLIAIIAIPVFAITATLAVNAAYGIDRTLGDLLGIQTEQPLAFFDPGADPAPADPSDPLYSTWTAPSGMPSAGEVGTPEPAVPNTVSGFAARPAGLYLPPAALVENPPRLPLVIMMMGQPGRPNPDFIAATLDDFAAKHDGLAPIALVVDQLGDPTVDPLCLDTDLGAVETYITKDVLPWAKLHLNVLQGAEYTTVAGYSNGGGCAAYFGAKYPDLFGNTLAIAPTEYPGVEHPKETLTKVFKGDQAKYDAVKPENIMAAKAPYADSVGIYAVGADDSVYVPGTKRLADAATAAGIVSTFYEVPGGDHGAKTLTGGLDEGFAVLAPRLGLEAPPAE